MKYLRCHLIHAGLCLLLICSANMASAQQPPTVSLSSSQTVVSRTIDFTVNLNRPLTSAESVTILILLSGVAESEIKSRGPVANYPISTCSFRFMPFSKDRSPTDYSLCMDAGEQNVTIRLVLEDSFDTSKAITISYQIVAYSDGDSTTILTRGSSNWVLDLTPMPVVFGLSAPRTDVGPIIRFNVDLSRQLRGDEFIQCSITLNNVSMSEVASADLVDPHAISTCSTSPFAPGTPNPLTYNVCMDAGERGAAIRLELNNPSNTTKTIAVSVGCVGADIAAGIKEDPDRSVLNFTVGPAIFIRSKVFLEGPLQ